MVPLLFSNRDRFVRVGTARTSAGVDSVPELVPAARVGISTENRGGRGKIFGARAYNRSRTGHPDGDRGRRGSGLVVIASGGTRRPALPLRSPSRTSRLSAPRSPRQAANWEGKQNMKLNREMFLVAAMTLGALNTVGCKKDSSSADNAAATAT